MASFVGQRSQVHIYNSSQVPREKVKTPKRPQNMVVGHHVWHLTWTDTEKHPQLESSVLAKRAGRLFPNEPSQGAFGGICRGATVYYWAEISHRHFEVWSVAKWRVSAGVSQGAGQNMRLENKMGKPSK